MLAALVGLMGKSFSSLVGLEESCGQDKGGQGGGRCLGYCCFLTGLSYSSSSSSEQQIIFQNSLSMPITVQQEWSSPVLRLMSFSGADSTSILPLRIMGLLSASRSSRKFLRWWGLPLAMSCPEMWQRSLLMALAMRLMTPWIFCPVLRSGFSLMRISSMIVSGKMILQMSIQMCSPFRISIWSIHRFIPTFWNTFIARFIICSVADSPSACNYPDIKLSLKYINTAYNHGGVGTGRARATTPPTPQPLTSRPFWQQERRRVLYLLGG